MADNDGWVWDIHGGVEGWWPDDRYEGSEPGPVTAAERRKLDDGIRAHEILVYGRVVTERLREPLPHEAGR